MRRISTVLSLVLLAGPSSAAAAGLEAVPSFGTNPGALQMFKYVPAEMPANAPLIVLLHGCTQNAAQFVNAGFNQIADDRKIVLPPRDELISKLMGTLQAPVTKLVRTLNDVPSRLVRVLAAVRDARQVA